ncbi:glycosyltransferase involved in cell wall biosynthesis [Parabacteroides sp. PF5-5]|uniref:glycosyltransferase n=1 Tax=unclassified Parabacteroides TaxID=2649774 RepID=UPI002476F8D9|nr:MULTISPECIES: glycosyltransferase [unclassified Parabacteroides]MDH6306793.1 glycosyltransferase involved in cell wall biosynthesis [Parabacteroides sp. PH5-39]MDH6317679.1 glycosyltransferase involved in cell wall biosynthesis [Parabacteroides sp. PF5-13]MDH6321505.1 glycosyltransferase involved in cell wall biosynthesis [Parabacteroides sp. PH5-13]MDH6325218.1 glycosyltransferase involved in cell wall biosynthesis [Parabacteroides sp. PH5-8]MDH6328864.1 glycosyltransferase involved in cel
MKIAMLSTFYPFRGGIAQFNANLYEAFKKADNEVLPFTFKRQYPDFLFPGKTQYVTTEDKALPIDSIPVLDTANPFSYISAANRISKETPDILIMKYWMSYFAPSLGIVARQLKKRGCKVLTVLDNVIPHEQKFFDKPFTTWFLKQNSGFVSMSESVQKDLFALYPDAKSILKPHPLYDHFGEKIDAAKAKEALGLEPNKKTILFFGLIRDYKGLDLLIDAVGMLDESYQLVIAGESYGSFEKYNEQIRHINHPERIKVFNRYISDSEVPLFFSAADVCVLPYRSATQSGITSIAYHFELPLLATKTGGLSESIEKPGVGLMIPEISTASIADTIQLFYKADRAKFISNIQKEKSLLSWDNFAEAILFFVKDL